jgi:CRISPR/Cas system CSM-associated protein Csm2 small subunit
MDIFGIGSMFFQGYGGNKNQQQQHHPDMQHTVEEPQEGMTIMENNTPRQGQNDPNEQLNNSSEESAPADDTKSRVELPSQQAITEAFTHLEGFSLAKVLPKDLKDPMSTLSKELRMQVDSDNMSLEENVRALFATNTEQKRDDMECLKEAMLAVLRQNTYLTAHSRQKQDLDKLLNNALKKIKKFILEFYPNLIQLMKALLAYHQLYSKDGINKDNQPPAIIFREWMKVLGYLQNMHAVLSFAARNGQLNLESFPIDFEEVIRRTNEERQHIDEALMVAKQKIRALQTRKLEEQQAIKAAHQPYIGISDQLANIRQNANSLAEKLHAISNPGAMARENIQALLLEKN